MRLDTALRLREGDAVYWIDPDVDGSRYYEIRRVKVDRDRRVLSIIDWYGEEVELPIDQVRITGRAERTPGESFFMPVKRNPHPYDDEVFEDPSKPFQFETTCVSSRGEYINEMTEAAREVTYETMRKYCDLDWLAATLGYERRAPGVTLKHDWAVSYWKSWYRGVPCYYVVWSHIEHIFTAVK